MGHPKAGGRVKGTPNKKTQHLFDICEAKGINPFEALLDLALHDDVSVKLSALKEICQYLYPKRKAIEMAVEMVEPELTNEQLEARIKVLSEQSGPRLKA